MKYSCKKTGPDSWVLLQDGVPFFTHWREEFAMMVLYGHRGDDEEYDFWAGVADERDIMRGF